MALDRDTKAVYIVEEDVFDRASLAAGHDDGPADQLLLGGIQFVEDVHGSVFAGAHMRAYPNGPERWGLARRRPASWQKAGLPGGVVWLFGSPGVIKFDSASPGLFPGQKVAALRRTARRRPSVVQHGR